MTLNTLGIIYVLLRRKWMERKVNITFLFQKDHNLFDQVELSRESHLDSENLALFFLCIVFLDHIFSLNFSIQE